MEGRDLRLIGGSVAGFPCWGWGETRRTSIAAKTLAGDVQNMKHGYHSSTSFLGQAVFRGLAVQEIPPLLWNVLHESGSSLGLNVCQINPVRLFRLHPLYW